jgi:hypothetical protein
VAPPEGQPPEEQPEEAQPPAQDVFPEEEEPPPPPPRDEVHDVLSGEEYDGHNADERRIIAIRRHFSHRPYEQPDSDSYDAWQINSVVGLPDDPDDDPDFGAKEVPGQHWRFAVPGRFVKIQGRPELVLTGLLAARGTMNTKYTLEFRPGSIRTAADLRLQWERMALSYVVQEFDTPFGASLGLLPALASLPPASWDAPHEYQRATSPERTTHFHAARGLYVTVTTCIVQSREMPLLTLQYNPVAVPKKWVPPAPDTIVRPTTVTKMADGWVVADIPMNPRAENIGVFFLLKRAVAMAQVALRGEGRLFGCELRDCDAAHVVRCQLK